MTGTDARYPETGTTWKVVDEIIEIRLGADSASHEASVGEMLWLEEQLKIFQTQFPNKRWGIAIDFSRLPVQQTSAARFRSMMSWLLKEASVAALAVIQAAHSYKVVIQTILFASPSATGKLKFFDQQEIANEWLKIKSR
ncbi:MAG: hypothetical protein WC497_01475 [Patescibacteria group bacterium]